MVTLDASQAAPLVVVWLLNNDKAVGQASTNELVRIASSGRTEKAAMVPVMKGLEQLWLARYDKKPLGSDESVSIVQEWLAMGNKAKAQVWTMMAYEIALGTDEDVASVNAGTLKTLGLLLSQTGLTGQGKEYPAFAVALARLAGQDKIPADRPWRYWYYAAPLGTPETRQRLQAELADKQGNPRLEVARILARAYRDAADRKNWLAFLDGKIAASAGDAKALWLLARAYGEASVPLKAEPQPIRARKWLEQVLDTTQNASLRIAAIEQLALGYATARKYAEGAVFLNSAAKRFTDEQTAVTIEALCAEHIASEVKYLKKRIAMFHKFANQMDKAVQKGNKARKEFFLKWAKYFRQREKDLLGRLEQIEQSN